MPARVCLLLVVGSLLSLAYSQSCPNQCSGHGACDSQQRCVCFPNFGGPDCSRRICDLGFRWSGKGANTHSIKAECSDAGTCDATSARCTCNDGYAGAACDALACFQDAAGNVCSKNGKCRNMKDLQRLGNVAGAITALTEYSNWDATRIQSCYCDPGFAGPDCGLVLCPKGDNPRTLAQQKRAVVIRADYASIPTGSRKIRFFFAGSTTQLVDLETVTDATCPARFGTAATLDAAGTVCKVTTPSQTSALLSTTTLGVKEYEIVMSLAFPAKTAQNNFFAHDENPPIGMFSCAFDDALDATVRTGSSCTVSYVDVQSMRLEGASGGAPPSIPAGESYLITVADDTVVPNTAVVTQKIAGTPPAYTSSAAAPMDALSAITGGQVIKFVVGPTFGHTAGATWTVAGPSNTITKPGYREYDWCSGQGKCDLSSGTCSCLGDAYGSACEALASEAPTESDLPGLKVQATSMVFAGTVLDVSSKRPMGSGFNYITVSDASNGPFFKLDGQGLLTGTTMDFNRGGRVDRGLIALMSDGLVSSFASNPALSVYFGSTQVLPPNGVAHIVTEFPMSDAAAFSYAALRVSARRSAGVSTRDSLLAVLGNGRVEIGQGALAIQQGGLSVAGGGIVVTGGTTSLNAGTAITGGLSVVGGSVSVGAGLLANAADVSGATTLQGRTTIGDLVDITSGGLSIASGGLIVQAGGASIGAGGLNVAAGAVSANGGGYIFGQDGVSNFVGRLGTSATTGGSVSALSGSFGGNVMTLNVNNGATGPYTFLTMSSGTSSLVVGDGMVIRSNIGLALASEDKSTGGGSTGKVSVIGGRATGAGTVGGGILVAGGSAGNGAGNGGSVTVTGGSSSVTAGSVTVVGGSGAATAGDAVLQAGSSATGSTGKAVLKDASGTSRLVLDGAGDLKLTPATYLHSTGALSVQGSARVSAAMTVDGALTPASFGIGAMTMCTAAAWTSGVCAETGNPASFNGGDPGLATTFKLYFNADFAQTHTVTYGASVVTIPPGTVFVVFT